MKYKTFYKSLISVFIISSILFSSVLLGAVTNIKNRNGKLYANIILLFNENPHFVNIIAEDTIPLKQIGITGFHIQSYKNYVTSIKNKQIKQIAKTMLKVYLKPELYSNDDMKKYEKILSKYNIVANFFRNTNMRPNRIMLNYCIYGKKKMILIKHPLLEQKKTIYNIKPYIYYDGFSTSNSTFYFDMIFINSDEVKNDYEIVKNVLRGKNIKILFFVGSPVTKNIKACLKKAFRKDRRNIKQKIRRMFVVHELTHKILNNRFNSFEQVLGEELSLTSTIYDNPFLGLSVMFSYLNYNAINPHRVAAINFINFLSMKTGKENLLENREHIIKMSGSVLRKYAKEYFHIKLNEAKDIKEGEDEQAHFFPYQNSLIF